MRRLRVLFKTKGGHKEGIGDVTSSLALAQEFRSQGHEVIFVINNNDSVVNLISRKGFDYKIANTRAESEKCIGRKIIDTSILNQLNTPEIEALIFRKNSKILVTIDDTGNVAKLADLRFNVLYPINNSYSDFKFIALSPIFRQGYNIPKAIKKQVEKILVTQGGSDTYGFTPKIIKGLYNIPNHINIDVILGPNFSHYQKLNDIIRKAPRDFNIIKHKSDLSDLMLQADLALSTAGMTLFELACLGVPTIILCGEIFEVETANRLQEKGFGKNLGFGEYISEKEISDAVNQLINDINLRTKMNKKGKELIDGHGAKRTVETIIDYYESKDDDCKKHN